MQDDCILVPLTKGRFAVIDAIDAERILAHKWHYAAGGYAARNRTRADGPGPRYIYMHRVIAKPPPGKEVDHRDADKLNNRRRNLRNATRSQNMGNKGARRDSATGYCGVHRNLGRGGPWEAQIKCGQIKRFLGYFDTPEAAARAYDDAARELFGEFARLNFPIHANNLGGDSI